MSEVGAGDSETQPGDIDKSKRELWGQIIDGYKRARVGKREIARRLGVSAGSLANLEQRGVERTRIQTLREYAERLTGWAEPRQQPEKAQRWAQTHENESIDPDLRAWRSMRAFDDVLYGRLTDPDHACRLMHGRRAD